MITSSPVHEPPVNTGCCSKTVRRCNSGRRRADPSSSAPVRCKVRSDCRTRHSAVDVIARALQRSWRGRHLHFNGAAVIGAHADAATSPADKVAARLLYPGGIPPQAGISRCAAAYHFADHRTLRCGLRTLRNRLGLRAGKAAADPAKASDAGVWGGRTVKRDGWESTWGLLAGDCAAAYCVCSRSRNWTAEAR